MNKKILTQRVLERTVFGNRNTAPAATICLVANENGTLSWTRGFYTLNKDGSCEVIPDSVDIKFKNRSTHDSNVLIFNSDTLESGKQYSVNIVIKEDFIDIYSSALVTEIENKSVIQKYISLDPITINKDTIEENGIYYIGLIFNNNPAAPIVLLNKKLIFYIDKELLFAHDILSSFDYCSANSAKVTINKKIIIDCNPINCKLSSAESQAESLYAGSWLSKVYTKFDDNGNVISASNSTTGIKYKNGITSLNIDNDTIVLSDKQAGFDLYTDLINFDFKSDINLYNNIKIKLVDASHAFIKYNGKSIGSITNFSKSIESKSNLTIMITNRIYIAININNDTCCFSILYTDNSGISYSKKCTSIPVIENDVFNGNMYKSIINYQDTLFDISYIKYSDENLELQNISSYLNKEDVYVLNPYGIPEKLEFKN